MKITRLQLVDTLYGSGIVLRWKHKNHGLYPLKWLGKIILKRGLRKGVSK